jgi:hypothetical protein
MELGDSRTSIRRPVTGTTVAGSVDVVIRVTEEESHIPAVLFNCMSEEIDGDKNEIHSLSARGFSPL